MGTNQLRENGFEHFSLDLDLDWRRYSENGQYQAIEKRLQQDLNNGEVLSKLINKVYLELEIKGTSSIEHMLALRVGPEDEDLDGIWHDDSSRHFAISLSLSAQPQKIKGGELEIRPFKRPEGQISISGSRPYAQATVFLTGKYGFEHRTRRVTYGNRLVLVLWVSSSEEIE